VVRTGLAGCATIPTSGEVNEGEDLRLERSDENVPFIGQPPLPGAAPADIVRGFLQSSADFVGDHQVAREYLTPSARQRWAPQASTTVFDRVVAPLTVEPASDGTVTVEGSELGRIDAEGAFRRSPPGSTFTRQFQLEQVDGEWRIGGLDDGLVLSAVDVREAYRQLSLYFLAAPGDRLVPDVVFIPELPGLTTKLVARLLRGPTATLRGAVRTAFPPGTALALNSVPVEDGVARVRLDRSALEAGDRAREQMSAQIVWTLKQLPEVLRVRITADGEDLGVAGVPEEQDRTSWGTYDPDGLLASPSVYVVNQGRVGRYFDESFQPAPGPAGRREPALRSPAVSLDGARLAAVSEDGRTLYVGPLTGEGGLAVRLTGGDFSQPSWDPGENLWVVDRSTGTLWYLANGADQALQVDVPRLSGDRLPAGVAVARDGVQISLVAGLAGDAGLVVGAVRRVESADQATGGESLSVLGLHDPLPDLRGVRDVAWGDATTLVAIGSRSEATPTVYYLDTDGYDVRDVDPEPGLVTVTAAPPLTSQSNPLFAGTGEGELLRFTSGRGWQPVGPGRGPAYPG
jgi:hypothetical protein